MYSAVCRTSLGDRQREKQGANEQKKERWMECKRGRQIRDGIKHCETERVNETAEKNKREQWQNN